MRRARVLRVGVLGGMALGLLLPVAAQAQDARPALLGSVFAGPRSAEIRPEARSRLIEAAGPAGRIERNCPTDARFVAMVAGAEIADQDLARARRDAVAELLGAAGVCARGCAFVSQSGAAPEGGAEVKVEYGLPDETDPPHLDVRWFPDAQLVDRGQTIRMDVTARDPASNFQSGVAAILIARLAEDDAPTTDRAQTTFAPETPRDCTRPPRAVSHSYSYTVGSDAPRLLRFRVWALDHDSNDAVATRAFRVADLNGIWLDNANGHEVRMTHGGGTVTATYLVARECQYGSSGVLVITTMQNFTADYLPGQRVEGRIRVCRFDASSAVWIEADLVLSLLDDGTTLDGYWIPPGGGANREISFTYLREQ